MMSAIHYLHEISLNAIGADISLQDNTTSNNILKQTMKVESFLVYYVANNLYTRVVLTIICEQLIIQDVSILNLTRQLFKSILVLNVGRNFPIQLLLLNMLEKFIRGLKITGGENPKPYSKTSLQRY